MFRSLGISSQDFISSEVCKFVQLTFLALTKAAEDDFHEYEASVGVVVAQ